MISEEKLISGCIQNNRTAQKELFERYAGTMKGVCLRYAKDQAESKDIMQEGFLKVFNNIKQYAGKGALEAWIKRIMINTAINYYRKNKRINEVRMEDNSAKFYHDDLNDGSEIDKKDVNTDKVNYNMIESANFSEDELLKVLQGIPEDFRLVFNMYFIENYKHEEIAEMLKINVNTSRTRLLRARNLIQKQLYRISIERLAR